MPSTLATSAAVPAKPQPRKALPVLGAHSRQHRRRLRRYRNEPALCLARSGDRRCREGRPDDARGGARRALAHPLGVDCRRHAEICAHPAAGGQQGRRRDACPDGVGAARVEQEHRRRRILRHHQRGAVLWRRNDHAGTVGAVRDRGAQSRNPSRRSLYRAGHGRDSRRPVCRAINGYREGGSVLRPHHRRVVRRHRHSRRHRGCRQSRGAPCLQPGLWRCVF